MLTNTCWNMINIYTKLTWILYFFYFFFLSSLSHGSEDVRRRWQKGGSALANAMTTAGAKSTPITTIWRGRSHSRIPMIANHDSNKPNCHNGFPLDLERQKSMQWSRHQSFFCLGVIGHLQKAYGLWKQNLGSGVRLRVGKVLAPRQRP